MIRDVTASDFDALLRLNLASEHFLSPMNRARLEFLQRQAAYCRVVWRDAEVAAFLLAFREGVDYDSPNYQWFARRYSSFLYIDRVVVDLRHHGKKLGSALYNDLFDFARASGVTSVACEFDGDSAECGIESVSRPIRLPGSWRAVDCQRREKSFVAGSVMYCDCDLKNPSMPPVFDRVM